MAHDFLQICYVTNDFDRAIEKVQRIHTMGAFKEMRDHRVPTADGRAAIGHFGLAFKSGTQYEIIQPLAGDDGIYRDYLKGSGFQMHFHHIGRHIVSLTEYQQTLAAAKARWTVPIDMAHFGGHYAYADARAEFGHYLEWFCFPDDSLPTAVPYY